MPKSYLTAIRTASEKRTGEAVDVFDQLLRGTRAARHVVYQHPLASADKRRPDVVTCADHDRFSSGRGSKALLQHLALDLCPAKDRRKIRDKDNSLRHFARCKRRSRRFENLPLDGGCCRDIRFEQHRGNHLLSPDSTDTHDPAMRDGVMPQQGRLNDVRIDDAGAGVDTILGAIEVIEETLFVEIADVVGPEPAAGKERFLGFIW